METMQEERAAGKGGDSARTDPGRKRWIRWGIAGGALVVAAAAVLMWLSGRSVSTDDAFVDGNVVSIGARVAGAVARVAVSDNQAVKAGDLLVEIDPREYRIKLAQAQASLEEARAQQARLEGDAARSETLFKRDQVSREALDHARSAAEEARARAALADQKVQAAALDLEETRVLAPASGRVGRRGVEAGAYVVAGQPLVALVGDGLWVTANFKETQITRMRPGQPAEIEVDAFPGRRFRGRVDSLQPGTGARFSLFPPENATGNFVKVVQRVPVKIVLDGSGDGRQDLSPGLSVEATVRLE